MSAAKLSGGAVRMGTTMGLPANEKGTPENHTGGKLEETTGLDEVTGIGMSVAGVSLSGK